MNLSCTLSNFYIVVNKIIKFRFKMYDKNAKNVKKLAFPLKVLHCVENVNIFIFLRIGTVRGSVNFVEPELYYYVTSTPSALVPALTNKYEKITYNTILFLTSHFRISQTSEIRRIEFKHCDNFCLF
jgi:hypothetical protein